MREQKTEGFRPAYSHYFKQNLHMFEALDFLADLTQLIRRYGPDACSSSTRKRATRAVRISDKGPLGGNAMVSGSFLGYACGTTLMSPSERRRDGGPLTPPHRSRKN